jgi:hypothetical protein
MWLSISINIETFNNKHNLITLNNNQLSLNNKANLKVHHILVLDRQVIWLSK